MASCSGKQEYNVGQTRYLDVVALIDIITLFRLGFFNLSL